MPVVFVGMSGFFSFGSFAPVLRQIKGFRALDILAVNLLVLFSFAPTINNINVLSFTVKLRIGWCLGFFNQAQTGSYCNKL